MLVLRRRVVAGLHEESSDVPYGNDVEDVLALELEEAVANPGTTIGRMFSVFLTTGAIRTSVGEKNVALSFSLSSRTFLQNPMLLCGRIVLVARFLPVFCPQKIVALDRDSHTSGKNLYDAFLS